MADNPAQLPSAPYPWWVLPGLAAMILVIYAGALLLACTLVNNDTLRTSMLGSVPVVVMAAINYFFGSSAGSDKKSDVIASDSANKSTALANSAPLSAPPGP